MIEDIGAKINGIRESGINPRPILRPGPSSPWSIKGMPNAKLPEYYFSI
jgi:hypothetical protein